ncbi:MAG: hypothetical protein EKK62_12225 [Acidimicrobiia bacterium]|nr:MAG: hypothetical protein EKK62_12225 [Acidimicrobiia bacterium]
MKSRVMKVGLGALLAMGISGAAAASLGGLSGGSLGADDQVIASCDTDGISSSYTTAYDSAAQEYRVTGVNFTGVNPACNAKAASVSLRNGTTNLGTTTASSITVSGNAFAMTLAAPVTAESVNGLSLVISG